MFGRRYFGNRFYGGRYWGHAGLESILFYPPGGSPIVVSAEWIGGAVVSAEFYNVAECGEWLGGAEAVEQVTNN
jgi:hypothetical protein